MVIAAFNQEKALVGAFSVITNLRMELFGALIVTACAAADSAETPRLSMVSIRSPLNSRHKLRSDINMDKSYNILLSYIMEISGNLTTSWEDI